MVSTVSTKHTPFRVSSKNKETRNSYFADHAFGVNDRGHRGHGGLNEYTSTNGQTTREERAPDCGHGPKIGGQTVDTVDTVDTAPKTSLIAPKIR
jgi:hypothetical protein